MQERTDDQLDDLFRKSAEEFDPPFDPAAWQVMRSRLDTHDRPQTPVFGPLLRWGLPSLLLLLLTVGGWYAYQRNADRPSVSGPTAVTTPATGAESVVVNKPPAADATDAPHLTDRSDPTNRVATSTKGTARTNQSARPELVASEPAGANVNRKPINPTRARPAFDRSTEPADQRSATARSSDNRRRRVGGGVTSVGPSPVQLPDEPLADRTLGDKTAASTGTTLRPATVLRNKNTSSMNRTPSPTRSRRLAGNVPELPKSRPSEQYAVGSGRRAADPTTNNVKNTGNRTNNVTALTDPQESELEREINGRPDDVTKLDRQPRTSPSPLDRSADAVKPGETVSGRSSDVPGNFPVITTDRLTNEPAVMAIRTLAIRPQRWAQPVFALNREVTAGPDEELEPRRPRVRPLPTRGLSVRFVFAPDLSTVGLRNFERPGTNLGVLVEYRLASRWSVQAGLMQSTKIYKASTDNYELPAHVLRWPVQPVGVSGRCSMFDIPINLRYDLALRPRANGQAPSRWFVSGGVTTYVMRQEDYYYNYNNPDDPRIGTSAYRREWHGSTGRYNFSQLNLSAGYERALGRRLAWQVEPFVKVPLRNIGYYKINLLSTGAFFSVRYRL